MPSIHRAASAVLRGSLPPAAASLLLVLLASAGCVSEKDRAQVAEGWSSGSERERTAYRTLTRLDRIAENPNRYFDRAVTVRGTVRSVWSPSTFTVAGADGKEVLVISPIAFPTAFPVRSGQVVQARGTVRPLNPEEFGEGYGLRFGRPRDEGFGPVDPFPDAWIGRPAIVAGPIQKLYFDPRDSWTWWARPATVANAF